MRALHTSDLHGECRTLLVQLSSIEGLDLWIDTGDFFPNWSRGDSYNSWFVREGATFAFKGDCVKITHLSGSGTPLEWMFKVTSRKDK